MPYIKQKVDKQKCGDCEQFSEKGLGCLQGTRKITENSKACKSFYKEGESNAIY